MSKRSAAVKLILKPKARTLASVQTFAVDQMLKTDSMTQSAVRPKEGVTRISHSPIPNQKQDNYKGGSSHTSLCGLSGPAKIVKL